MFVWGYEYVSFDNLEDVCFYLMNNYDIDLIFSDIMLLGCSGLDMLDSIWSWFDFDFIFVILFIVKVEEEDVWRGI